MKKRISVLLVIALWGAMFGNDLSASIFIGGAHIDSTKDTVVSAVSIFNISGQLVQTLKITQSNMVVPVKSGVYIVKIGDYKRKVVVL